jgi:ribosomal-protein-alanine N-acetyltransferase
VNSPRISTEIYGGEDYLIKTDRLDLHAVQPPEYEILALDRADPTLWIDRGFTNPHRHLVDDPGPLLYRIPRIRAHPEEAKYLLRMIVLRDLGQIIGSAGFHSPPDESGMIEIGLGIVPAFQGRGYAQEALRGMWDWVVTDPLVRTLRYTVSPENAPSQAIIAKFGFHNLGQQIDEEDGPEDIFEMSIDEYQRKFDLS